MKKGVLTTSEFKKDFLRLPQQNYSSIYMLLLTKITNFSAQNSTDLQQKNSLIPTIRKLILDHERSLKVLNFHLKQTVKMPGISASLADLLQDTIQFCKSFQDDQCNPPSLEARFQRQVESNLAIHLLRSPSRNLWRSVNKVSATIIDLIRQHQDKPDLFSVFLVNISGHLQNKIAPTLPFSFAHFPETMALDGVVRVLEDGSDLAAIMLIHFMFMRDVCLALPIPANPRVKTTAGNSNEFADYLRTYMDSQPDHQQLAAFFCNYRTISPIYSQRGRGPTFRPILDNHLGIVVHEEDRKLMPTMPTSWYPDCVCQEADLSSPYTQLLLQHEIPYISGPSGMTSIFVGALSLFGNFTDHEANYYLLAVLAYMVSGGLHSMHEVLSIPHIRLGLLPDYQAAGAKVGNYDSFFYLFSGDSEVQDCIDSAWAETNRWMNTTFSEACSIKISEAKPDDPQDTEEGRCCIL